MTAEYLGTRQVHNGAKQSLYRLSAPLLDVYPESRNVVVIECVNGDRIILRGKAYKSTSGKWRPIPTSGSWIRCYSSLSARDLAFAQTEIGVV